MNCAAGRSRIQPVAKPTSGNFPNSQPCLAPCTSTCFRPCLCHSTAKHYLETSISLAQRVLLIVSLFPAGRTASLFHAFAAPRPLSQA